MKMPYCSRDRLIENPEIDRPHVVLLGAGASRAAFPDGDRYGRKIPIMNDLVDVIPELREIIQDCGVKEIENEKNFETIYSRLEKHEELRTEIEQKMETYFESLALPEEATLYDLILLSLRREDAVFTFNWDPFLFDSFRRNSGVAPLPEIYFLHGNVRIGMCSKHHKWGGRQDRCPDCHEIFYKVPLLYPTEKKGYSNDPYIKGSWDAARSFLSRSLTLTVFGYSAPHSDKDAVDLLKEAYFEASYRTMEHVEIIDIEDSRMLYKRWRDFTPTHHRHDRQKFYESFIARWPRRSREAVFFPMTYGIPCEEFPLYDTNDLSKLQEQASKIARYESNE